MIRPKQQSISFVLLQLHYLRLVLVELSKKTYYLTYLQGNISEQKINSADRCPNISELFNDKQLANYFRFNHKSRFDCNGRNECEKDGSYLSEEIDLFM